MSVWYGKHWIRDATRERHYLRSSGCCMYCVQHNPHEGTYEHQPLPHGAGERSLDHLVPRTSGGTNDADNVVPACKACNTQRGARPVERYLRVRYADAPRAADFAIAAIEALRHMPLPQR